MSLHFGTARAEQHCSGLHRPYRKQCSPPSCGTSPLRETFADEIRDAYVIGSDYKTTLYEVLSGSDWQRFGSEPRRRAGLTIAGRSPDSPGNYWLFPKLTEKQE